MNVKTISDPLPFAWSHDEERDAERFGVYLATLPPDGLWDVLSHVDEDRFPRRHEAVRREIARRNLFFVPPYTPGELRWRTFLTLCVCAALLSATLRLVGSVTINLAPGERLPFFTDLAVGAPKAARLTLPPVRCAASLAAFVAASAFPVAATLWVRRRLRGEIVITTLLAGVLSILLLWLAWTL